MVDYLPVLRVSVASPNFSRTIWASGFESQREICGFEEHAMIFDRQLPTNSKAAESEDRWIRGRLTQGKEGLLFIEDRRTHLKERKMKLIRWIELKKVNSKVDALIIKQIWKMWMSVKCKRQRLPSVDWPVLLHWVLRGKIKSWCNLVCRIANFMFECLRSSNTIVGMSARSQAECPGRPGRARVGRARRDTSWSRVSDC